MADTPTRQRADEEVIVAWIRDLNDKAVELTDHKPQVFEVRKLFLTSLRATHRYRRAHR